MKKNILRSVLCLALLLAVMAGGVWGVNRFAAPIVAENERLAAEAAAAAEKEKLGDSVLLFDRADPAVSELSVTAETVQKIYRDESKQVYTLSLSSFEGFTKDTPIELTLVIDFEGRIVSLTLDGSGETKELSPDFLPSFAGQDSTLAGVELVVGATKSSSAIRNAVNDGFNTLIDNGLFAAAEKDEAQLLRELVSMAYSGIVNKEELIQGEELAPSGVLSEGYAAANGSGALWFVEADGRKLLAVYTHLGGVSLFNAQNEEVTDSVDPALIEEIRDTSIACIGERDTELPKALVKLLPEEAEAVPADIPGLTNTVTGAWTVETEEGTLYAFHARPYGYQNEPMDFFYVLDETGAIVSFRVAELILYSEYFSDYTLDETAYKEGFLGLTADSYDSGLAQITGATRSSVAADTAVRDVFEAFRLLTENRG
jgi:hypothetical protein